MLGAMIGDICGSIYEFENRKTHNPETIELINDKCYYTDDSVLTIAVSEAAFGDKDYEKTILKWTRKYPHEGYGYRFRQWFQSKNPKPYNSYGNGSAMRVSPIGFAFDTLEEVLREAERSAACTHNHPEGIKGAQATAAAVFLARTKNDKRVIKEFIENHFGYNLSRTTDEIRPNYDFEESCQGTVPEAITCFLESKNFYNAIQLAISLGGDSDTMAAITGGIAEAFYRIPSELIDFAYKKINVEMELVISPYYDAERSKMIQEIIDKAKQRSKSE